MRQSQHRQGQGYTGFNAPIMKKRQHCCVHEIMLYNRIEQLVSLYSVADLFLFFAIVQCLMRRNVLTNETNIPNQWLIGDCNVM